MSTALATVSSMNDAPLDSEFPCRANEVPRDLVKSRAFFVAFPRKFSGCLLERLLHFTVGRNTSMTSPRTKYLYPAMLVSVLAILIFNSLANAQDVQSETGTVRGAVAMKAPDGQSYNIPAASLKLKRGLQVAETAANDAGEYEFTKLLPGDYTLEATAAGFKASSKTITIAEAETLLENISLEVADVTASVTVASASQDVQTTETTADNTVKRKTMQTLPLQNEQLLDALRRRHGRL
jgi:hypothetical protein